MWWLFSTVVLAFGYVGVSYRHLVQQPAGNERMQEIASYIRAGAQTFLRREYQVLSGVVVLLAFLLYFVGGGAMSGSFLLGAVASAVAGLIGMQAATAANVRVAEAARTSLDRALRIGFSSGAILGIAVVGLGLGAILFLTQVLSDLKPLFGLSFGASTVALFARVGGGIFTKSADMAADLVGKVEVGIPEDDPRNPAVIADNVGDNVGDVAGMGADLFESYVGCIVSSVVLGALLFGFEGICFPLSLAAIGIVASVLGTFFVHAKEKRDVHRAFRRALFVSNSLLLVGALFLSLWLLGDYRAFFACVAGVVAGTLLGLLTEYFTSTHHDPVKSIVKQSETGAATNLIEGLSTGFGSAGLPVVVIALAIFISHWALGLYGISLAAVSLLSTLGISLAVDAFGPAVDNAGGIAEMAKLPKETRERTDILDAVGNTTAAIGKGFAIGSAALTALTFFFTYTTEGAKGIVDLQNPLVMIGILVGGAVPFIFCALTMKAVSGSAHALIHEVRRQFREEPGILEGSVAPDYVRCIDIATKAALWKMIVPGLLAIAGPILIKTCLGFEAVSGFLAGSLVTGVLLAIALANAGGAWDNAKKLIEAGALGGKGSPAHHAAVIGDTVGDPLKDTAGPSLNILIKLMTIVALVLL